MNIVTNQIFSQYQLFFFVFARITGFILIVPILSRKNIPIHTKIIFSFFLAILLMNSVEKFEIDFNEIQFILILIKEMIVGFLLGFIAYIFFVSLLILGQIVDMQIGFAMVKVFDPQNNSQISIVGNFYYILALLFFLSINGHHTLIRGLNESFTLIPINSFMISEEAVTSILYIIKEIFNIGFKLSSPVLATIFLVNTFLGVLARTVPQMNVFVVGMPLKIIVGVLTIIITLPLFIIALQHIFENMYEEIFRFLKIVSKG